MIKNVLIDSLLVNTYTAKSLGRLKSRWKLEKKIEILSSVHFRARNTVNTLFLRCKKRSRNFSWHCPFNQRNLLLFRNGSWHHHLCASPRAESGCGGGRVNTPFPPAFQICQSTNWQGKYCRLGVIFPARSGPLSLIPSFVLCFHTTFCLFLSYF
jgi:hypothetical protein